MSNRLLGILIISGFILLGLLGYVFFFLKNSSHIVIVANEKDYKVEFSSQTLNQSFTYECPDFTCEIKGIPSISYDLIIKKDKYEEYRESIKVPRSETITKKIGLKKLVFLSPVEEKKLDSTSVEGKIEDLRFKADKYKVIDLGEKGLYYFSDTGKNKLSLNYIGKSGIEETDIVFFDMVNPEEIHIIPVYGDTRDAFLKLGTRKYILKKEEGRLIDIALDLDINYVKKDSNQRYFFTTKVGTYILENKDITYWPIFFDGISVNYGVIGIIQKEDIIRKKNYSFDESGDKSHVVLLNEKTLQRNILLSLNENVSKLYVEDKKIYVEDVNGKKYILEGIE